MLQMQKKTLNLHVLNFNKNLLLVLNRTMLYKNKIAFICTYNLKT